MKTSVTKNDVIKMGYINSAVSSLAYSIIGGSIFIILGLKGFLIYVSVINIAYVLTNFISALIQRRCANVSTTTNILQVSMIAEIVYTFFHIFSDLTIYYNVNLFMALNIIALLSNSVCSAMQQIYTERVLSIFYNGDYVIRSTINSNFRIIGTLLSLIGNALNLVIVFVLQKIFFMNEIKILYIIVIIHVIIVLIDCCVTIIERNVVFTYFKNNGGGFSDN